MFHCKILAFVWGGLFCFCRRVHVLILCKRCIRVYCTSVFFWQKQHSYADWSWVATICLNAWTEIEFTPKSAKCKSQGYLKKIQIKKNTNKNPHKQFHAGTSFFALHQISAAELLKSVIFGHGEGHSSISLKKRQTSLEQMSLELHRPLMPL